MPEQTKLTVQSIDRSFAPTRAVVSDKGTHSARRGDSQKWREVPKQQNASVPSPVSSTAQLHTFFEAGPANTGALPLRPAQGALRSDGSNARLGAGVEAVHFCKFKKSRQLKLSDALAPELLIRYLEEEYLSLFLTKKLLKNVSIHFKPEPFTVDAKLSASGLHPLSISMKSCQMFRRLQANTAIIFSEINTFLHYSFYIANF